jgi:hypothetical protein
MMSAPIAGPQIEPSPPRTAITTRKPLALKSIASGLISPFTNTNRIPEIPAKNPAITHARYLCRPVR